MGCVDQVDLPSALDGYLARVLRALDGAEHPGAPVMFGEVWGDRPPRTVALHGWRRTHSDFAHVLGPESEGGAIAAVAPDLPGFGATAEPPATWGSPDYARAVAGLIEGGDGPRQKALVLGHSLGGRVGVTLAAERPDLVGALVLVAAPLLKKDGSPRPPGGYRALRSLRRIGLISENRMERARQRYGSADYASASGCMREVMVRLVNESYDDVLPAVRCPVELVWGSEDTEAPLWVGEQLAQQLPGAELTVCQGAGHLLPVDQPKDVRAAVERALARL